MTGLPPCNGALLTPVWLVHHDSQLLFYRKTASYTDSTLPTVTWGYITPRGLTFVELHEVHVSPFFQPARLLWPADLILTSRPELWPPSLSLLSANSLFWRPLINIDPSTVTRKMVPVTSYCLDFLALMATPWSLTVKPTCYPSYSPPTQLISHHSGC